MSSVDKSIDEINSKIQLSDNKKSATFHVIETIARHKEDHVNIGGRMQVFQQLLNQYKTLCNDADNWWSELFIQCCYKRNVHYLDLLIEMVQKTKRADYPFHEAIIQDCITEGRKIGHDVMDYIMTKYCPMSSTTEFMDKNVHKVTTDQYCILLQHLNDDERAKWLLKPFIGCVIDEFMYERSNLQAKIHPSIWPFLTINILSLSLSIPMNQYITEGGKENEIQG
jgi:hypothetical protein